MNQLSIWQMVVDLGLISAVLTMAVRWMKGSKAQALIPQTLELEAALKNLIADADAAGRHLNDQLLRRETNIQKYLAELEESERRITRSVVEGEEAAKRVESIASAAEARLHELAGSRDSRAQAPRAAQPQAQAGSAQGATNSSAIGASPAKNAASSGAARAAQGAQQKVASRNHAGAGATSSSASAAAVAPTGARSPSRTQASAAGRSSPTQAYQAAAKAEGGEMQKVYAAAEHMLRQGVEFEKVAAQTKLPVEGVKMLSQMIEVERIEDASGDDSAIDLLSVDPRLGALGVSRRQTNA